jgi:hypothetical protein
MHIPSEQAQEVVFAVETARGQFPDLVLAIINSDEVLDQRQQAFQLFTQAVRFALDELAPTFRSLPEDVQAHEIAKLLLVMEQPDPETAQAAQAEILSTADLLVSHSG